MRFAVSTWTMGKDQLEAVRTLADLGVELVELWPDPLDVLINRRKELSEELDACGVHAVSLHLPFTGVDPAVPDEAGRRAALKLYSELMRIAASLGCEYVVLHPGTRYQESLEDLIASRRAFVDTLKKLDRLAGDLGLRIAIENMIWRRAHRLGATVASIRALIKDAGAENAGVCLDTGHAHINGLSPAVELLEAGSDLVGFHLNDNCGTADDHMPPGGGSIDWESFRVVFREVKPDVPLLFEVHSRGNPAAVVEACQRFAALLAGSQIF